MPKAAEVPTEPASATVRDGRIVVFGDRHLPERSRQIDQRMRQRTMQLLARIERRSYVDQDRGR